MVKCTKCKKRQDRSAFYWRKDRDQLRQPCRACIAAYGRQYKERDAVKARLIQQKSYQKHRDKRRAQGRRNWLLKNFGLTVEQYEAISQSQDDRCAICRQPETVPDPRYGHVRALAVDHCHETGIVRGLLCVRCNVALGRLRDDVDLLRAAIAYLEEGGKSCQALLQSGQISVVDAMTTPSNNHLPS